MSEIICKREGIFKVESPTKMNSGGGGVKKKKTKQSFVMIDSSQNVENNFTGFN